MMMMMMIQPCSEFVQQQEGFEVYSLPLGKM